MPAISRPDTFESAKLIVLDVNSRALHDLFGLLASAAAQQYGDEPVTQLEHALQCAALAREAAASDTLVIAALFHDIGHLLQADFGKPDYRRRDFRHERAGAEHLSLCFGEAVTGPVRLHVAAKRCLCAVEPGYWTGLSEGSQHSLALQGGPLAPEQARRFQARPYAGAAIALRRWDDAAKVAGATAPALASFYETAASIAKQP